MPNDTAPAAPIVRDLRPGQGRSQVALVLAGGVALGAYEAGAYAALADDPALRPAWLAGASIGAVNAALIAGAPPGQAVAHLRAFWDGAAEQAFAPLAAFWRSGPWRAWLNQRAAWQTLLFGRLGLFRPRLAPGPQVGVQDTPALFDLAPLRRRLDELVDWDRLNDGATRLALCCTDVLTGERVVFDTGRGDRIGSAHVVASSALMPLFAPVELDGRLLADGALSANTPLDLVLDRTEDVPLICFVVELFARAGQRPHTLAASASRAGDLAFGNQTRRLLEGRAREYRLAAAMGRLAPLLPESVRYNPAVAACLEAARMHPTTVATLAYRAGLDEAGLLKPFDFSADTLADRWSAGEAAMREALHRVAQLGPGAGGELRILDI